MEQPLSEQSWIFWAIGLAISVPVLTVVLGELIVRMRRSGQATAAPLRFARTVVLPMVGLLLLLVQVVRVDSNSGVVRLVETAVWMVVLYGALSLLNALVFADARQGTWRARVPRLFLELIRVVLVLVGLALVLSFVWERDLGNLLAALGVGSIVLGLALQDTLGGIFSGVALLYERPFETGDWIRVGDTTGKVVQIDWRSVHLQPRDRELLIVPNSVLAGAIFSNYSKPSALHVERVVLGFSYDDPPNKVKRVLQQAALETPGVLEEPEPDVFTTSYDDFAITYVVKLFITDYDRLPRIKDSFNTRIWYAAQRNRLTIPFPIRTVEHRFLEEPAPPLSPAEEAFSLLSTTLPLRDEAITQLVDSGRFQRFGDNEVLLPLHDEASTVGLVLHGYARVTALDKESASGRLVHVVDLERGEFFGETALLMEEPYLVELTAQSDLEVLTFDLTMMQALLDENPPFAREMDHIIQQRRRVVEEATLTERQAIEHLHLINGSLSNSKVA